MGLSSLSPSHMRHPSCWSQTSTKKMNPRNKQQTRSKRGTNAGQARNQQGASAKQARNKRTTSAKQSRSTQEAHKKQPINKQKECNSTVSMTSLQLLSIKKRLLDACEQENSKEMTSIWNELQLRR